MEPNTNYLKLPKSTLTYMLTTKVLGVAILFAVSFFIKPDASSFNPLLISGGVLFLGVLVVMQTILYYNLFSFFVSTNEITINSGIIFRQSKTIDFRSIQNMNSRQNPIQMFFGLTELQIWTSSPGQFSFSNQAVKGGTNSVRVKPEASLILLKSDADVIKSNIAQLKQSGAIVGQPTA